MGLRKDFPHKNRPQLKPKAKMSKGRGMISSYLLFVILIQIYFVFNRILPIPRTKIPATIASGIPFTPIIPRINVYTASLATLLAAAYESLKNTKIRFITSNVFVKEPKIPASVSATPSLFLEGFLIANNL